MEKATWKAVEASDIKPCSRWGSTCCVIGEEIVIFGGYETNKYMNDVWTYNTSNKQWKHVETTGDKPSKRSSCSMSYDADNQWIIIFGGGAHNKQRFNSIYMLDWKTKKWTIMVPDNEAAPRERSYHTAELKFPYLLVFGGEGEGDGEGDSGDMQDLADLWVFKFFNLGWTEVKLSSSAVRPQARRFHTSCMIGNQMFVIAGCYGKYKCLKDVYSMNITSLIETGETDDLCWIKRNISGDPKLARWGHSSAVYNDKIYIFSGRFGNDLNDLLVFDPKDDSLRTIQVSQNSNDLPKGRRRHCSGFVGSCMLVFGGFNGEYFNDLFKVDVDLFQQIGNINFPQEQQPSHLINGEVQVVSAIPCLQENKLVMQESNESAAVEQKQNNNKCSNV